MKQCTCTHLQLTSIQNPTNERTHTQRHISTAGDELLFIMESNRCVLIRFVEFPVYVIYEKRTPHTVFHLLALRDNQQQIIIIISIHRPFNRSMGTPSIRHTIDFCTKAVEPSENNSKSFLYLTLQHGDCCCCCCCSQTGYNNNLWTHSFMHINKEKIWIDGTFQENQLKYIVWCAYIVCAVWLQCFSNMFKQCATRQQPNAIKFLHRKSSVQRRRRQKSIASSNTKSHSNRRIHKSSINV